jgi:hypothetical protein
MNLVPFLLTVLTILVTAFVVFSLVPLVADGRLPQVAARLRARLHARSRSRSDGRRLPSRLA